jgi:putative ABC transport system permease protein
MFMIRLLPLILKNTLRNRRRTALTVASIAVSLGLLGVLMSVYRALFYGGDAAPGDARRVIVHHKISLTQDLPVSYERQIQQIPGVAAVTRLRWFGGAYRDARDPRNQFARFAIEPQTLFDVHPEYKITGVEKSAFQTEKAACVVSRKLAAKFGWKPGERITLIGDLLPINLELTLAGIFDSPQPDEVLYFNWDYLHDALPAGDDRREMIQQFHVEVASGNEVVAVANAIDGLFTDSPYPTKTEPEQAFMLSFISFLGNLKLFLAAICGAVMFTILLVSANTLSMSIRERTREVGILKTLGFRTPEVLGIIVGEAALIALSGGVLGCMLAAGLCAAIGAAGRGGPAFVATVVKSLNLTPGMAALTCGVALLVGMASALVPGWSASRSSILDSLRYTG